MTNTHRVRLLCETENGGNIWWLIGALAGVAVVFLILLIRKLAGKERNRFDERQIAARGVAFKYGFFTVMIYEAAYVVLRLAGVRFADESMGPLIGIFFGAAVFGSVAVVKDAYAAVGEKPSSVWIWYVIGGLWSAIGVMKIAGGEGIEDGVLTADAMQLVMGLTFLTIGLTDLIHRLICRRGEGGEE